METGIQPDSTISIEAVGGVWSIRSSSKKSTGKTFMDRFGSVQVSKPLDIEKTIQKVVMEEAKLLMAVA